jgi:hypothetical protein
MIRRTHNNHNYNVDSCPVGSLIQMDPLVKKYKPVVGNLSHPSHACYFCQQILQDNGTMIDEHIKHCSMQPPPKPTKFKKTPKPKNTYGCIGCGLVIGRKFKTLTFHMSTCCPHLCSTKVQRYALIGSSICQVPGYESGLTHYR